MVGACAEGGGGVSWRSTTGNKQNNTHTHTCSNRRPVAVHSLALITPYIPSAALISMNEIHMQYSRQSKKKGRGNQT